MAKHLRSVWDCDNGLSEGSLGVQMTPPSSSPVRFVAYYRVSTERQGRSGLGLDAQRVAVARHAMSTGGFVCASFEEVESGKRRDRPQLAAAMAESRARRAVLLIAKRDRLARAAHFLLGLEKAGVEFVAVDMPHANRLTIGIMALVAEEEARAISSRTRASSGPCTVALSGFGASSICSGYFTPSRCAATIG